jgi:SAM-dependent methyltransferase
VSKADEEAQTFWDKNQHINQDPTYWMADPQCRLAINRRVCGEPSVWPLEAFKRFAGRRFKRGLSLGSGLGSLERTARQLDLCEEIEGIDGSEASLQLARSKATEEGLSGISYRFGNLNSLQLPRAAYDVVFFHASLHHVRSVEKLLARVERAMTPEGVLFIEEWVGPSRDEWNAEKMSRMRALYDELPPSWKLVPTLQPPILVDDPSEAVRSSAILPAIRRLFDVLVERPYGGHLVAVILSQLAPGKVSQSERQALIQRLLALEELDLAQDPSCTFHTALVAQRKRGPERAAGHVRNVLLRPILAADYWISTGTRLVWSRFRRFARRVIGKRRRRQPLAAH